MKNIETKVKVTSLEEIRNKLKNTDAEKVQTMQQCDTYFHTKTGRLKLREIHESDVELIYYMRPNDAHSKTSSYEMIRLEKEEGEKLKHVLEVSNGIQVIVEKSRELWMYKHTHIHLDTVKDLGEYVEAETVVKDISLKEARVEHEEVISLLQLKQSEFCEESYSDYLLKKY